MLDKALNDRRIAQQKVDAAQFQADTKDAVAKEQAEVIRKQQKQRHDAQKDYTEKRNALLALKNPSSVLNPKMRKQIVGAMQVEARKNPEQFIALVQDIASQDPTFLRIPEVYGLWRELQAR